MPLPNRKSLPHEPPLWVRREEAFFFLTICCQQRGTDQLCLPSVSVALLESAQFRHQRGDWWLDLILLMPDHVHLLACFPAAKEMPVVIKEWKAYTAKRAGVVWQRGFFDYRLRREESLREKADYILHNPVRKGLVTRAEDWPHVWMAGRT
jgi:REP element-mobilizing transposase RayT